MKTKEDIVELILRDHKPLKTLIETLKDGDIERSEKEGPYEEFVPLLMAHAKAEEKSLYIQMKEIDGLRKDSLEGHTEHAIADRLIHEINGAADDQLWGAKVKVLAELVGHHIEEEEDEMMGKVEQQMDTETRQKAAAVYTDIKTELDTLNRPLKVSPSKRLENHLN